MGDLVRQRRYRQISIAAFAAAATLFVASPYMTLWSMATCLRSHDDASLRADLDWSQVRDGLKRSLGLQSGIHNVSAQDELPGFGESFASNVASGMIDEDVTPARLDAMMTGPAWRAPAATGMPHGFFDSPASFTVWIARGRGAPIGIGMRIEQWRWKITRISLPQDMLQPRAMLAGDRT